MASKTAIATIDRVKDDVVLTFANGAVLKCNPKKLPEAMQEQLMYHGFTQKARDSYANAKGDANWAQAQAEGVIEGLQGGSWNRRGGGSGTSLLIEAVARIKEIDIPTARAAVEKLNEAQLAQLKASKTVKRVQKEIEAERARAADTGGDDEALALI